MNRNKEYRLKRKNQRKDYIIQDKNVKLKTMYYQNKNKNETIEKLKKENKKLKEQVEDLKADYGTIAQIERDLYKDVIEEVREYIDNIIPCIHDEELLDKLLQILDKGVKDE